MVLRATGEIDYKRQICEQYNAMFEDRTAGGDCAVDVMKYLEPSTKSILIRHEACYILGQMKDKRAVPLLTRILNDPEEHEITRHEAAEALGAIGDTGAMDCLCQYSLSESVPLRETCELGIDRLTEAAIESGDYNTVDPVAVEKGANKAVEDDVESLLETLLAPCSSLTDKYKALFSLRSITDSHNQPSIIAIAALGKALANDKTSSLLRHEIGFVIGQMAFGQDAAKLDSCVDSLIASVENTDEHCMVRHESAIALGSISGANGKIESFLTQYADLPIDESNQEQAIVIESCIVAMESLKYWRKHS